MSEELQLSRRGLLQMMGVIVATASFAARWPLFGMADRDELVDAEIIDSDLVRGDRAGGAKLEQFLKSRGIKPAHLARESGYSRQHLLRIRLGRFVPTRRCVAEIVRACRRLAREPVLAGDLFDLSTADARVIERMQRQLIA